MLNQLELEQAEKGSEMEKFLELHLYMTSMKNHASLEAFGLQMALDFIYEKVYFLSLHSTFYLNADITMYSDSIVRAVSYVLCFSLFRISVT